MSEDPGGGNATYCAIGPLKGSESAAVKRFNRAHRDDGYTARFQTLGDYVRIPDVCDVSLIDAAWIAHHVEAGAIADLTERVEERLTGREEAVRLAKRHRLPTALSATYEGAVVLDWLPYSMELERTLESARAHPITPRWPEIERVIGDHVHSALTGRVPPRAALAAADREVSALLRSG